jgi:hypothetical protein
MSSLPAAEEVDDQASDAATDAATEEDKDGDEDDEDDEGPRLDTYEYVHLGLLAVLPSGHRCLVDPDTDEVICVQSYDAEGPWTEEECTSMHMAFRPRDPQQLTGQVGLDFAIQRRSMTDFE